MGSSVRTPLLVCSGSRACAIGSKILGGPFATLFLDTDSRTQRKIGENELLQVGLSLVKGEGAGGNLNLARACFKQDLEEIAVQVLGRPLVAILCDIDGATSIAGAVEVNSLLIKVGLPTVVFLMMDPSKKESQGRSKELARVLMEGPLRPGVSILLSDPSRGEGGGKGKIGVTEEELLSSLASFLSTSSRKAAVQVPTIAWTLLRDNGGPFGMSRWYIDPEDENPRTIKDIRPPSITVFRVGSDSTTDQVKELLDRTVGGMEDFHIGMTEDAPPGEPWTISSLHPLGSEERRSDEGSGPRMMKGFDDILAALDLPDMSPSTNM